MSITCSKIERPSLSVVDNGQEIGTVCASIISMADMTKLMNSTRSNGGISLTLLGSSRSGKTTFMKQLLPMYEDAVTILFAPNYTAGAYDSIRNKGSNVIVRESYDPDIIGAAEQFQKKTSISIPFCFILDDVIRVRQSAELASLFLTLRNLNISTIMVTQYYAMITPEVRTNANFSFYFRINTREGRKRVATMISDMIGSHSIPTDELYDAITSHFIIMSDNINGKYYLLDRAKLSK